jgi:spore germination cell wall hydrolase CwlJ-like protein
MNVLWQDYQLTLLALVIWRETRGAGAACMAAVGCSIRNRVKKPTWWGKNYIDVITKKWQYSSMAALNDPQLVKYPQAGDTEFDFALRLAADVIIDKTISPFPGADSYFDDSIPAPKWATPETFCGKIGRISFYNLDKDVEA